jgi:hypothetical protein
MIEPFLVCPCDDCPSKGGCGHEDWTRLNPGLVRGFCSRKPKTGFGMPKTKAGIAK